MKPRIIIAFCFITGIILNSSFTYAQGTEIAVPDTIYMKSNDKLLGKVLEIGILEIKYKDASNLDGPVIVLRKSDVQKVSYANGTETLFTKDPYEVNQEVLVRDKTHAIKFEFLSPVRNNIAFSYEHMIKVGMNVETKLGIIGAGIKNNDTEDAKGVYIKAGVKFLTSRSEYYVDGLRYVHALKGFYIKPELIFNSYTVQRTYYNYPGIYPWSNPNPVDTEIKYTNYAVNLVLGKQYLLANILTFEYYAGIGYGHQEKSNEIFHWIDEFLDQASYSHTYLGNSSLIITGGITLGVIF